ncbi:sigma-70 family RNA polymerase sigma factor [Streptomyces sp. NPDC008238]
MHASQTPPENSLEVVAADFDALRPRLFLIACRVLGSASEAEDVVQDTWLRWQGTDRARVLNPPAFLARTATRLALNAARSARLRYEIGGGTGAAADIDSGLDLVTAAERAEALELVLRLILEKLNPTERAAFVLRVAFDYPYSEIAENLRMSQSNTRQIVSRARKHLFGGPGNPVSRSEHRRFLKTFTTAARSGNLTALEDLLAQDAGGERDKVRHAGYGRWKSSAPRGNTDVFARSGESSPRKSPS